MKIMFNHSSKAWIGLTIIFCLVTVSCKKFVDTDTAPTLVGTEDVYNTDGSATSAVVAMYSYTYTPGLIGYSSYLGGVYADELQFPGSSAGIQEFAASNVTATNSTSESYLWIYAYNVIGQANLAIAGLNNATSLTPAIKSQLLGEAKFFRAFAFFHLVNYFGGVPLSLSAAQLDNAFLPRTTADQVWTQILIDLKEAQALLPAAYAGTSGQRARVNKWAATALLARAYLYNKDYVNAEAQSSQVIGSGTYGLDALNNVFISTSNETILQLATYYGYSTFGPNYRTTTPTATSVPPSYVLAPALVTAMEKGDNRKTSWIDSTTYNAVKYYRINKYKLATATAGNEFNVILRLAEQYLIRAEARAQQGNISGAQSDLNTVRNRAGLPNTTVVSQSALLTAIASERKVELFGELAHRWFDLKRTGQADAVIGSLKPTTWKTTALLLPIPSQQIILNKNLVQNPGYNQ